MDKPKKIYEVEDLPLATWLVVAGHPMLKNPKPNPARNYKLIFTFEHSEKLEEDVLAYNNKTARIDPLTFAQSFRQLKAYSVQQSRKSGGYYGNKDRE